MFHTFETAQFVSPNPADVNASSAFKRRTTTVRACEPCRRRKIRCNGEKPCETCQWYRKAASCHYTEPRQRQMPSRRSVEKISHTLQQYRSILQKLFPNVHPEQLQGLTREKLMSLISKASPCQPPSPATPRSDDKPDAISTNGETLEQLQFLLERTCDIPGSRENQVTVDSDLSSFLMNKSPSYVGISSPLAALRAIFWLDPECQALVNSHSNHGHLAVTSAPSDDISALSSTARGAIIQAPLDRKETQVINAYFQNVHPFVPLIEEHSFRETYLHNDREDSRWCLLLNTVLAVGSITDDKKEVNNHAIYFDKARAHLNTDTLNSAHLETVQALALLSGMYLIHTQQQNLVDGLMGAALRMATSLGLHRECPEGLSLDNINRVRPSIEMRRRVWWSLFLLESWASSTFGTPSIGRFSGAITIKEPQEPIGGSTMLTKLMQENIRFAIITTQMEESLSASPLMDQTDRQNLDSQFVDWLEISSIQSAAPDTIGTEMVVVNVLKKVMRWRYLCSRVVLHRPVLLRYAMQRVSVATLSDDTKAALELCREIAAELITDISGAWMEQKEWPILVQNATSFIYQAVTVPLLSLFTDPHDYDLACRSQHQTETAITILTEIQQCCSTAKHILKPVSQIYEAIRRHYPESQEQSDYYSDTSTPALQTSLRAKFMDLQYASTTGPSESTSTPNEDVYVENIFNDLKGGTEWNNHDHNFVPRGLAWDQHPMNAWSASTDFSGYYSSPVTPDPQNQMRMLNDVEYGDPYRRHELSAGRYSY